MNDQPMHVLTQSGVLTTFSMSKKITEKEVNALMADAQKQGKTEAAVMEILRNKIMQEIIEAVKHGTIPGVIVEGVQSPPIPIRSVEELNKLAIIIGSKFSTKKYDKLSMCYFINYLVNVMGLTEEDFEEFHRKMREVRGDDEDDE